MPELDAEHRNQIAEALGQHHWLSSDEENIEGEWVYGLNCECGEFVPVDDTNTHVADALAPLVAGWLAEVEERARFNDVVRRQQIRAARTDAWDEGVRFCWDDFEPYDLKFNPYRGGDDD